MGRNAKDYLINFEHFEVSSCWTIKLTQPYIDTLTKMKTIALTFLVLHVAILIFICATWYRYNRNVAEFGGEMADGIFAIVLFIATIYYFGLTVWTYSIYKKAQQNKGSAKSQLMIIFVLGILTTMFLLYKIYG